MKKTNKVKIGPLGTPLGNPLGYFNSLKGKNKVEPKQTFKFGGLRKKDCGGDTGIPCPEETAVTPEGKPLGANIGVGNFSAGYSGKVGPTALTDNKVNAGYTNANTGFGARGAYDFNDNSVDAKLTYKNNGFGVDAGYNNNTGFKGGLNYTGDIKGTPVKVGFTYNQKGGVVKGIYKKLIKKVTKPTGPKMQKGGATNMDPGFTKTPKRPYKNMDPGFTKTPSKPYRNMDPGFFKTPKINSGNKDVFKNAGPAPQPKGYKRGGLTKRK